MLFGQHFSDKEVIQKIRNGDRSVLTYLFNQYRVFIKDFVVKQGGGEGEADELLKSTLIEIWLRFKTKGLDPNVKLAEIIMEIAQNLWKIQEQQQLKVLLDCYAASKKKHFSFYLIISILLLLGITVVTVLLYRNYRVLSEVSLPVVSTTYTDTLNVNSKSILAENERNINLKKGNKESIVKQLVINDSLVVDTIQNVYLEDGSDTVNISDENEFYDVDEGVSGNDVIISEIREKNTEKEDQEIIIKKDQLLFVRTIEVKEKKYRLAKDVSIDDEQILSQQVVEKLNNTVGEITNEEPVKNKYVFQVEFWKSPVNYKGYKMIKNKLVLYGISQPEHVKLYLLDGKVYMSYDQIIYLIERTFDYQYFIIINEESVIAALKS